MTLRPSPLFHKHKCVLQAHAQLLDPANYEGIESGLTWLGVAGLLDPPRPEVRGAIADCVLAGIRVSSLACMHPVMLPQLLPALMFVP